MARAPQQARTLNLSTQCIQNLTHSKTIRSLELFSHQHCTTATPQWLGSISTHRRPTQTPHVPTHTPPTPTPTPTHCLQCSWAGRFLVEYQVAAPQAWSKHHLPVYPTRKLTHNRSLPTLPTRFTLPAGLDLPTASTRCARHTRQLPRISAICRTASVEYASLTCIPDTKAYTQQILTYTTRWPLLTSCLHPRRKTHTHSDTTP
jgi:hypothetical protein